jgi:hypothetical protein
MGTPYSILIRLPPLATVVFRLERWFVAFANFDHVVSIVGASPALSILEE